MSNQGGGVDRERVVKRFTVTLGEDRRMEVSFRVWEDVAVPGDVLPDYQARRQPTWQEMEMAASQLRRFLSAQLEAQAVNVHQEEARA